ncbi:tetratricopeptide repeat protein [Bacillus glycinifermentans]|uniref:Aspartate phosphatase n=1 Tax=Bacillus glycinifermentans TaxID=1664069 RepID=A0A0T6BSE8_9BACI|nr:tetratricopeptide repeat protein [Bacillus glycinifermentans]ATH94459.1 tetratricopeptide repeat protein [Bacillus glycinifermentans]KRT94565.1 aspartate phosphatase [Bacillus glycinifermentans]MEC0486415.1 tetratricopeptide repeat protein [Bacillus glycinifermentans]
MKQKIPSENIAIKINDWYSMIRRNQVTDAEFIKAEIQQELEEMEENQTVLLYYSLIDFRHNLMLKDMKPNDAIDISDSLSSIETKKEDMQNTQVDEMIHYYYWFFKGMYEFKQHHFNTAITCYKIAEKKLASVDSEEEKAEFYYKLSEIYYHLRQNYISMNYATMALDTFKAHETLIEKEIYCYFVIAGNQVDTMKYKDALTTLQSALLEARKTDNNHLIAAAYFNLGNCYFYLKQFSESYEHILKSLSIFKKENSRHIPKALFQLMYVCLKQENDTEALSLYEQGIEQARSINDKSHEAQLNILRKIYLEHGSAEEDFKYLEDKGLYADVEELAFDAAEYYNKIGKLDESVQFYRKTIQAMHMNKKGS